MKTYYGYYNTGSGGNRSAIVGHNLRNVSSICRDLSEGGRCVGNQSHWEVYDSEDGQVPVASGGMNTNGLRYRIY